MKTRKYTPDPVFEIENECDREKPVYEKPAHLIVVKQRKRDKKHKKKDKKNHKSKGSKRGESNVSRMSSNVTIG